MHESQSPDAADDDTKNCLKVLGMEDMRVKACLIENSVMIASWTQMREEILEITRKHQFNDSQLVPGVRWEGKGKRQRPRQPGHIHKPGQGDAEERTVIAKYHPNHTAAVVLVHCSLPNEYVMTFPMAYLNECRKTSYVHRVFLLKR